MLPLLGVSQKHQAKSHSIYAEDLLQTPAGPVVAASVSVSSYAPCLVDSVGRVSPGVLFGLWLLQSSCLSFPRIPVFGSTLGVSAIQSLVPDHPGRAKHGHPLVKWPSS